MDKDYLVVEDIQYEYPFFPERRNRVDVFVLFHVSGLSGNTTGKTQILINLADIFSDY